MTASKRIIQEWLAEAKKANAAFLIVGYDWFDHENFPIYCKDARECNDAIARLARGNNKYDEVYDMSLDIDAQLKEPRAIHFPAQ